MAGVRKRPIELWTQHTLGSYSQGLGFTPMWKGMWTNGRACVLNCALERAV